MIWSRCLTPAEVAAVYQGSHEGRPAAPTEEEVAGIIARLGAERFREREAAQEKLRDFGPAVEPTLKKHQDNPDPEIRARLHKLLREFNPRPTASSHSPRSGPRHGRLRFRRKR